MNLILASKSPRRSEILRELGVKFTTVTAETDESTSERDGERYVREIALRKGEAVKKILSESGELEENDIILACDTVVESPDGEIMGKPRGREDAERMILSLAGRSHKVISGVALLSARKSVTVSEVTEVNFDKIEREELRAYLDTDEAYDKAGAYAIQGRASLWITGIRGDYFNVVGLPVKLLSDTLKREFGESLL